MTHDHAYSTAATAHRGRLAAVLAVTCAVLVFELLGAWWSGSLALVADAGHLMTDAAGVAISLIAVQLSGLPPTSRRTFGLQRGEILAAFGNAVLLVVVCTWVTVEAIRRLTHPEHVDAGPMTVVAAIGLVANAGSMLLLRPGQSSSLTVRGAYLEVLGDLVGSFAVVIAGGVIAFTGWQRADPVASLVVAALIVPRALHLLRETTDVLLEATPRNVDLDHVRQHILGVEGVLDVHELHAWTITSGLPVLSAHVVVDEPTITGGHTGRVLDQLGECLDNHFDVEHSTFQIEPATHRAHESVHHP